LSTEKLCREFRDTWVTFFHLSGMCARDEKTLAELQTRLHQYDHECNKRGIYATPCTVSGLPEMVFSL
jgi:hypothetical protein